MKYLRILPWLLLPLLLCGCADTPPEPETDGIDGIPLAEFIIVADDAYGFTAADFAAKLQAAIAEKYGVTLSIISDETETTSHEIVICSDGAHREVPEMKAGALVSDGHLFLYAPTNAELGDVVDRFIRDMLNADVPNVITNWRIQRQMKAPEVKEETIKVEGDTAKERGDNLRAAVAGLNLIVTADAPVAYIIELSDGEYLLTEPIEIGKSAFAQLTFRAAKGAEPVITGAVSIPDEAFTKVEGENYYVATIDSTVKARDILADGKTIPLARTEFGIAHGNFANVEDRYDPANSEGLYMPRALLETLGDVDGSVEATFYMEWQFNRIPVVSVDWNNTRNEYGEEEVWVEFDPETLQMFCLNTHHWMSLDYRQYYYANHVSLLTPGTCVSDYHHGKLYYYPESGAPKNVSYAVAEVLLKLNGAQNVTFDGITFTGTTCRMTAEEGYNSGQANWSPTIQNGLPVGALLLDDCRNIKVSNCNFRDLGTNGIRSMDALNGFTVENSSFTDVAMAALSFGDYNHLVYDKKFAAITVHNNHMERIGMDYPSSPAIMFCHVDGVDITHNTIHNVAYTGISLGWSWNHVGFEYFSDQANIRRANIAYNSITDYMRVLKDGGAIYAVGGNCIGTHTELFNVMHHNYAANPDTLHTAYYLDECSTNWHLYDNVSTGASEPLACQFNVQGQYNQNVLCERLYATEPINKRNRKEEHNVDYTEGYDGLYDLDTMFEIYPEAKAIVDGAGVIKE